MSGIDYDSMSEQRLMALEQRLSEQVEGGHDFTAPFPHEAHERYDQMSVEELKYREHQLSALIGGDPPAQSLVQQQAPPPIPQAPIMSIPSLTRPLTRPQTPGVINDVAAIQNEQNAFRNFQTTPTPGTNPMVGRVVQGAADALGAVPNWFNWQGALEQPRQAVAERKDLAARARMGENVSGESVKMDAAVSGALGMLDAIVNSVNRPKDMWQQFLGAPKQDPQDLAGLFKKIPKVQEEAKKSPALFGQNETIGSFAAPLPHVNEVPIAIAKALGPAFASKLPAAGKLIEAFAQGAQKGKFIPRVANDAMTGAGLNAVIAEGEARKQGRDVSPGEAAGAIGTGAAAGAGLGTLFHGVPAAAKLAKKGVNASIKKSYQSTPAQAAANTATVQQRGVTPQDLAARFPDNAEFQALAQSQPPPLPAQPPPLPTQAAVAKPANTWQGALDAIKNATPETYDAAMQGAGALRDKLSKGTSKEYRKGLKSQLENADTHYRGLQTTNKKFADNSKPIGLQRIGESASAPVASPPALPEVNTGRPETGFTKPAEGDGRLQPGEPGYHKQRERDLYPDSYEPLQQERIYTKHQRPDGGFYTKDNGGQAVSASSFSDTRLNAEIDEYNLRNMLPKVKAADRRENDRMLRILNSEKMRREYRKTQGEDAPNWPAEEGAAPQADASKQLHEMSDDELHQAVANSQTAEEVTPILDEMERRQSGQNPGQNESGQAPETVAHAAPEPVQNSRQIPPPVNAQGEFRYVTPQFGGHEKPAMTPGYHADAIHSSENLKHLQISQDGVSLPDATKKLVQAKVDHAYAKELADDYGEKLFNHFKDSAVKDEKGNLVLKAHKHTLTQSTKTKETRAFDRFADNLKYNLQDLNAPDIPAGSSKHTRTTLADSLNQHLQDVPMPTSKDVNSPEAAAAFERLKTLKHAASNAEDVADAMRKGYSPLVEQAESAHNAARNDEHLMVSASGDVHHLDTATGAKISEPVASVFGHVEHVKEATTKPFLDNAEGFYRRVIERVKPILGKPVESVSVRAPNRPKAKAAGTAGALLAAFATGTQAHAAEIVHQAATNAGPLWLQIAHNPITPAITAAATVATAGRAIAKKVLSSKNIVAQSLFNDTMDAVTHLDTVLGTKLAPEIWNDNLGTAYQATFGVHFKDPAMKQEGINLLRDGTVTPAQALQGHPKTVFENMTPEQRNAIVTYRGVQTNLRKIATKQLEKVDAAFDIAEGRITDQDALAGKKGTIFEKLQPAERQQLVDVGMNLDNKDGRMLMAKDALNNIIDSAGGVKRGAGEKVLSQALNNFMDYNFFWNVEHHGTNLTDAWIAGGSRVGPINILNAHVLLDPVAGDADLKRLFKDSNLLGGTQAERSHIQARSQQAGNAPRDIEDLPSDKINADRVALGAFLQFHGMNKKTLGGNDVDFVKQLLTSKSVAPDVAARAWGHMAEVTSRTIGVDPYRLNLNMLLMAKNSPALGIFVRQPARIARLATHYMAEGNFKGLMTMLGFTALFAGKNAMPDEVQYGWSHIDPEGFFKTAKMLDDHSLAQVTGENMGPKLSWSVLWPMMAASQPFKSNVEGLRDNVEKGFDHAIKYFAVAAKSPKQAEKMLPDLAKLSASLLAGVGQTVAPRIAGVLPTRDVVKGLRSSVPAVTGKQDYFPPSSGTNAIPHKAGTIDLDQAGVPRAAPFMDQFIPGTPQYVYNAQMSAAEKKNTKGQDERMQGLARATRGTPAHQFFDELVSTQKSRHPIYSPNYSEENPALSPFFRGLVPHAIDRTKQEIQGQGRTR